MIKAGLSEANSVMQTTSSSQTELGPDTWIDPVDLIAEVVAEETEFTIENGRYRDLDVTVKRSADKNLIEREVEILRTAACEFVVSLCGCFKDAGIFGFVTQRYAVDLRDWSINAAPSANLEDKMLQISSGIVKGLAHINSRGIIHNDIKPQNIFVDEFDRPHIGDFGVATKVGEPLIGFTKRYFDQESLELGPDEKSDGWLLGATIWELWSDELFSIDKEIVLDNIRNERIKDMLKALLRPRGQRSTAKEVLGWFSSTSSNTSQNEFIVDICGWFEEMDAGIVGLVMQKCHTDLTGWSSSATPAELDNKKLQISIGIVSGLAHINNLGILHNDLKPHNVFVDKFDKPFIGDFGVATNSGEKLQGYTVQYFDRESLGSKPLESIPDEKSDSWLLGATIWEFWSGELFSQDKEISMDGIRNDVIKSILNEFLRPRAKRSTAKQVLDIIESAAGKYNVVTRYWDALAAGDTTTLREILSAGSFNVESSKDGVCGLQYACRKNLVEVVKILLEFGADHERRDENGKLPIQLSTSLDVWRAFLGKMRSPIVDLDEAVQRGHDVSARLILAAEENPVTELSKRDNEGNTPLHCAASEGNREVCRVFLCAGAEIDASNPKNETPLLIAARRSKVAVMQLLLQEGADIEARGDGYPRGSTPLLKAAGDGQLEVVRLLLDKGANIESRDSWKNTPLRIAAAKGHLPLVQLLVESGADIEGRGWDERTPLLEAAVCGHLEVARFLLDKGADIESRDEFKGTPLIVAAEKGHLPVVQLLVERRADIEGRGFQERTALLAAASCGQLEVVRLLLDKGADIESRDQVKSTPLIVAAEKGHLPLVQLLVERRADIEGRGLAERTALLAAASCGQLEVARFLLEKGADIESRDLFKKTPLIRAAEQGHLPVVQLLVESGADVGAKDKNGDTPRDLAVKEGHSAVAGFLAKHQFPRRSIMFSPLLDCFRRNN
ncbi:PR domain zinc finger protein 4 [Phlyctochytrium bullatum]|nr:PR domain zinc finger protein 4 [Phlyctochytrium bullatum]